MGCQSNGLPGVQQRPAFRRLHDSDTGAISISWTVPAGMRMVMEQITAHWDDVPATSEPIELVIDSVNGPAYDTVLLSMDPSADGVTDWVCTEPFRFDPGDTVIVTYTNTDANTVGVEVWLKQVDS